MLHLDSMQKRGKSRSDCFSLARPAYKFGPWEESGNLDFGRAPTIPRTSKSGSLYLTCLCKQQGLCWISASLRESAVLCQRLPIWPAPSKNSSHCVSNELLWLAVFYLHCHKFLLGELSVSCVTPPQERTLGNLYLVSSELNSSAFSLCWFLFVSFRCNKS